MKIILTGSSSGIGRRLVEILCAKGHTIIGLARSDQAAFEIECNSKGWAFMAIRCDVSDWNQMLECGKTVCSRHGVIDALICCAGVQPPIGSAMSVNPLEWHCNIRINLGGTFNSIRAFYEPLSKSLIRSKVICFSGGGATGPRPSFSAYACAKAGIVRLVETLAGEWSEQRIDINAVAPGAVHTAMTEEIVYLGPEVSGNNEFLKAKELTEGGNSGYDQIVGLVCFLLSSQSDGVTGRLISAQWDPWASLHEHLDELEKSDIYCLRRIVPEDRNKTWK
jgi:NAD(P)-dependent dehydrogenase (short-subunit alcohol dehydrogenase family)